MSTFPHTDWFVICDGHREDGFPCPKQLATSDLGVADGTAAYVRKVLKKRGWATSVPSPAGLRGRQDFCPEHKPAKKG